MIKKDLKHVKTLTVIIPTRGRLQKLKETLASIPTLPYVKISVICDDDAITKYELEKMKRSDMSVHCSGKHKGSVWCRNLLIGNEEDGVLYATDDIIFLPNSIQTAFETFNRTFLDDDGIVGFLQRPGTFDPTGVGLVGQTFLKRFPNKVLFFPKYYHFASQEIGRLCERIKIEARKVVFVQHPSVVVEHKHPGMFKELIDQTHRDARVYKNVDQSLSKQRKQQNLVWGRIV